jgi:hypothetical protein
MAKQSGDKNNEGGAQAKRKDSGYILLPSSSLWQRRQGVHRPA